MSYENTKKSFEQCKKIILQHVVYMSPVAEFPIM